MNTDFPRSVDRLIIHQFDPARPSPGGIDTCLRGIARYAPSNLELAFVGVDTGNGPASRELGRWERHEFGERSIWFLPVAKLDPANQRRRIPHSVRLSLGLIRFWRRLPKAATVQAHRMDIGTVARTLFRTNHAYFIHTQDHGLTGKTSDSMWRKLSSVHRWLERLAVAKATQVVVFNPDFAETVRTWNSNAQFSPTWFDPGLLAPSSERDPYRICWVGRLEVPKDPLLAIRIFDELKRLSPEQQWSIDIIGSGTLSEDVVKAASRLDSETRKRVTIHGRVSPENVAKFMGQSGIFLMTSHPGYEGYPRVLVEAMASGLPCVVTEGSDTGGLVVDGKTGYSTSRDPNEIARRVLESTKCGSASVKKAVEPLSAPQVVGEIYSGSLAR